jgi:uncharacterized protein (DUF433 family)
MRIALSVIAKKIPHGATRDETLAGCPDLEPADVEQVLEFAAWLSQEEVHSAL